MNNRMVNTSTLLHCDSSDDLNVTIRQWDADNRATLAIKIGLNEVTFFIAGRSGETAKQVVDRIKRYLADTSLDVIEQQQ